MESYRHVANQYTHVSIEKRLPVDFFVSPVRIWVIRYPHVQTIKEVVVVPRSPHVTLVNIKSLFPVHSLQLKSSLNPSYP